MLKKLFAQNVRTHNDSLSAVLLTTPHETADTSVEHPHTLVQQFLTDSGLTQEDLQAAAIDPEQLSQLLILENSLLGKIRWINLDYYLERLLHLPWMNKNGIHYQDHEMPSFRQAKFSALFPIWIAGRSLPCKSKTMAARAVAVTTFRANTEQLFLDILKSALLAFTIYRLNQVNNAQAFFATYTAGDDNSIRSIIHAWAGDLGNWMKYGIITPLLLSSLAWGLSSALWNWHKGKSFDTNSVLRYLASAKNYPVNFFRDYLAWFIPLPPYPRTLLSTVMNNLQRAIRWHGDLPLEIREHAFAMLLTLAQTRTGFSKISALQKIAELAHGIALSQFSVLKKGYSQEERQQLLAIKMRSLTHILENVTPYGQCWRSTHSLIALGHNLYANYARWTLGYEKAKLPYALFLLFKLGKLALTMQIFYKIIDQIIQYLHCPNKPFNFAEGFPPHANLFSSRCFTAMIENFGIVPNQPIEPLLNEIQKFNLGNLHCLDLSTKNLTASQVVQIVQAVQNNKPPMIIFHLNLANNQMQDAEGIQALMPLLSTVKTLEMANNNMAFYSSIPTIAFAEGLPYLTQLEDLGLADNSIGYTDPNSIIVLAHSISNLLQLRSLNLARNIIGLTDSNGTIALAHSISNLSQLQSLNLANTCIGCTDSNGTIALAHGISNLTQLQSLSLANIGIEGADSTGAIALAYSISKLSQLQSLNLEENNIGYTDSNGTIALAHSISKLSQLQSLNLAGNYIGSIDSQGILALSAGLSSCPTLQTFYFLPQQNLLNSTAINLLNAALHKTKVTQFLVLPFNTIAALQEYLNAFDNQTTHIDLSGLFNNPSGELVQACMQALQRFTSLQSLSLKNNHIGLTDSNSTIALAYSFTNLSQLQLLNLEGNNIWSTHSSGAISLAQSLANLSQLQTLNLAYNCIGCRDSSTIAVAHSLANLSQLQSLNLEGNLIGSYSSSTIALAHGLTNLLQLRSLNLEGNYIGSYSSSTIALAHGLTNLSQLQSLNLANNDIGYVDSNGTIALSNGLYSLTQLLCLSLNANFIGTHGTAGPDALLSTLVHLTQLQSIQLAGNTNFNPTLATQALAARNSRIYQQECQNNLCFNNNPSAATVDTSACDASTTTDRFCAAYPTSAAQKRTPPWPFHFVHHLIHSACASINHSVQALLDKTITAICHTVEECPSYFPNAEHSGIHDWSTAQINHPADSAALRPANHRATLFYRQAVLAENHHFTAEISIVLKS